MNKKHLAIFLIIPLLTSCNNSKNKFYIEFFKDNVIDTFYNKENNNIDLSLYRTYDLNINVPSNDWINNKMEENIDIKYDKSKFNIEYFYESAPLKFVKYHIQPLDIFNNEEVVVSFNQTDYKININSSLKSIDDLKMDEESLNKYVELKEMIDSISYYSYQTNYPGISSYNTTEGLSSISESFSDDDSSKYFQYLKDDCYYPTNFKKPSSKGSERTFYMYFDTNCDVSKDSKKSPMISYIISNKETSSINQETTYEMRFEAINKNYKSSSLYATQYLNNKINDEYYLLSKKYQDKLLNYKINDLDITFLKIDTSKYYGFFEDDTYLYKISYFDNCYYK